MMMVAKIFIDTNVLLRVMFAEQSTYPQLHLKFNQLITNKTELWISGQIVRELIVQATHP